MAEAEKTTTVTMKLRKATIKKFKRSKGKALMDNDVDKGTNDELIAMLCENYLKK
jgi:hypothetical protein